MARKARIKSSTGIYHVLVRAIADLSLFSDEEDVTIYTQILNDLQLQGRCQIYAYAYFPTHVHLLIREGSNDTASCLRCEQDSTIQAEPYDNSHRNEVNRSEANRNEVHRSASESSSLSEPIGSIMKRIANAYSYYFNVKYDHYGPIYIDRFKSNPVETKDYFLKVLNHIGSQQTEWKYTCHHIPSGLINDTASSLRCEHGSTIQAEPYDNSHRSEVHRSNANRSTSASCSFPPILEYRERTKRLTDSKLLELLISQYHFTTPSEFLQRDEADLRNIIASCKRLGGSVRQLVRLTGTPFAKVATIR